MARPREHPELLNVSTVYGTLREQIVQGIFEPDSRINVDAAARKLGVSQTPVREAMQHLMADGLVSYSPGKGYATTPVLDYDGLRGLFEFRMLVEPWASGLAAVNSLANPASRLESELETFRDDIVGNDDIRLNLLLHDTAFHDAILGAAHNDVVHRAYARTHAHLHSYRLFPVDLTGEATLAEHGLIIEAIRGCDAIRAQEVMAQHLMNSFDRSAEAFGIHIRNERIARNAQRPPVSMVRNGIESPRSADGPALSLGEVGYHH